MLRAAQPDIIAITGDLIDSRHTDVALALDFAAEAVKIAPCYYVTGNHESRLEEEYAQLKAGLLAVGVVVLENDSVTLERDGETIRLLGVQDPAFEADYWTLFPEDVMDKNLAALSQGEGFRLLLSHRPEYMDMYARYSIDLVLSGHAHGGQFRLPWIGGLYAPGQGLFPEYDAGMFSVEGTQMIVSRGIGNSAFPLRFNNRPEVVLITLTR
jgi:predicted MPP superfamily phosphohydrolase